MINQAFVTLAKTVFMHSSLPIKTFFFVCASPTICMCAFVCVGVVQLAALQTGGQAALPFQRVVASQMFPPTLSFPLAPPPPHRLPPRLVSCCFFNALSQSGGTYVVAHFPPFAQAPKKLSHINTAN